MPNLLFVNAFNFPVQLVGAPKQALQVPGGLFGLAGAGDGDGGRFYAVRQPDEGLAGQRVENGVGAGGEVGEGLLQGRAYEVEVIERGGQHVVIIVVVRCQISPAIDFLLRVPGETLVAEALSAGCGEDGQGGYVGLALIFIFQGCEALGDEGIDPVAVLPGGDLAGLIEEVRGAEAADDLGGGGGVFLAANQLHFFVGEAVEVHQHAGAAGDCGEGGGFDFAFEQVVHALADFFDGAAQAFGDALVGAGGLGFADYWIQG